MNFGLNQRRLRLGLGIDLELLFEVLNLPLQDCSYLFRVLYGLIEHGGLSHELAVLLKHGLNPLLVHASLGHHLLVLPLHQLRPLNEVLYPSLRLVHFDDEVGILFVEVVDLFLHLDADFLCLLGGLSSHELKDSSADSLALLWRKGFG